MVKRPTEGEAALILLDRAYRSGAELMALAMLLCNDTSRLARLIMYEAEYLRQYQAAKANIIELNRQAP